VKAQVQKREDRLIYAIGVDFHGLSPDARQPASGAARVTRRLFAAVGGRHYD
jgi:hypothetical protein